MKRSISFVLALIFFASACCIHTFSLENSISCRDLLTLKKGVEFVCDMYYCKQEPGYTGYIYYDSKIEDDARSMYYDKGDYFKLTGDEITAAAKHHWSFISDETIDELFTSKLIELHEGKGEKDVYIIEDYDYSIRYNYIYDLDLNDYFGYKANDDGTYNLYYSATNIIRAEYVLTAEEYDEITQFTEEYTFDYNGKTYKRTYDQIYYCVETGIRVFRIGIKDGKADYVSDEWCTSLPDSFDTEPEPENLSITTEEYKKLISSSAFVYREFYWASHWWSLAAGYIIENMPEYKETRVENDWQREYAVIPEDKMPEVFYTIFPEAPAGFFEGYLKYNPVTLANFYNAEDHVYELRERGNGIDVPSHKFVGGVDNGDGTIDVIYSKIDSEYDRTTFEETIYYRDYGVVITLKYENGVITYVSTSYINGLPKKYSYPSDYGDVTGDGVTDNKDVVALFRYLSGGKVEVIKSLIDLNYDGWSDNKDIVVLFKYVSSKK